MYWVGAGRYGIGLSQFQVASASHPGWGLSLPCQFEHPLKAMSRCAPASGSIDETTCLIYDTT